MAKNKSNYDIDIKKLIGSILGLNRTEVEILLFLDDKEKISVKDIVPKSNKDRTTVQKVLTKLLKAGWISKRQINLERGFHFVYFRTKNPIKLSIEEHKRQSKYILEKLSELL